MELENSNAEKTPSPVRQSAVANPAGKASRHERQPRSMNQIDPHQNTVEITNSHTKMSTRPPAGPDFRSTVAKRATLAESAISQMNRAAICFHQLREDATSKSFSYQVCNVPAMAQPDMSRNRIPTAVRVVTAWCPEEMSESMSFAAAGESPRRLMITRRGSRPRAAVTTMTNGNRQSSARAANWKALFMKSAALRRV